VCRCSREFTRIVAIILRIVAIILRIVANPSHRRDNPSHRRDEPSHRRENLRIVAKTFASSRSPDAFRPHRPNTTVGRSKIATTGRYAGIAPAGQAHPESQGETLVHLAG
jgi:hypothetical protein